MRQVAALGLTDERHGNISLNNEQHLFTSWAKGKIVRKNVRKALEERVNCAFCYVEPQGRCNEGLKIDNPISEDCGVPCLSDVAVVSV